MTDYDLIVIGAGVGGHAAALHAVQCGLKTAIVEAAEMGGTCINRGCIPSKALLSVAGRLREIHEASHLGISVGDVSFDRAAIADRANAVVSKIRGDMTKSLQKAKVDILQGFGRLTAATTVEVTAADGTASSYSAKDVIIATGSTPFVPPGIETDGKTVFTSDEAVRLESLPKKLAIVGSGYIGLEFADVYTALGCEVVMLEALDKLMPAFDPDIARQAQKILIKGRAIEPLVGILAKKVAPGSPVVIELSTGDRLEVDGCLIATGRVPVTKELGLDALGIDTGRRGFVPVDDSLQTAVPHLWAIGDATGKMMLAHAASAQGIAVVETICGRPRTVDYRSVPAAVFTHPEMGFAGLTEPQAKEAGYPVKTVRTYFGGNSKAIAAGETDGIVKLVIHKESGELLGAHIFGPHAADLIHEASQAIADRQTVDKLATLVHTHPTLAETLEEAYHRAAH